MLDEWLTEVLGYPVYNSLTPPESDERSLTCAKVPVSDVGTVHELTELGFRIVDVNVQLGRKGYPEPYTGIGVMLARTVYHKSLLEIAGTCFNNSRFHHDPLIPNRDANRIKREWLRNCLNGKRSSEVWIGTDADSGQIAGFLAIQDRDGKHAIDLLGVAPAYRRWGVGTRLVQAFICRGNHDLLAGTSISNSGAIGLYESRGFLIKSSAYVFHLHRGVS